MIQITKRKKGSKSAKSVFMAPTNKLIEGKHTAL
jgi:hypothetical protein